MPHSLTTLRYFAGVKLLWLLGDVGSLLVGNFAVGKHSGSCIMNFLLLDLSFTGWEPS